MPLAVNVAVAVLFADCGNAEYRPLFALSLKDAPCQINHVVYLCARVVKLNAHQSIREGLRRYLSNSDWSRFIRGMENDKYCQTFYRDESRKAPKLNELLQLAHKEK